MTNVSNFSERIRGEFAASQEKLKKFQAQQVEVQLPREAIELPKSSEKWAYDDAASLAERWFVPEVY